MNLRSSVNQFHESGKSWKFESIAQQLMELSDSEIKEMHKVIVEQINRRVKLFCNNCGKNYKLERWLNRHLQNCRTYADGPTTRNYNSNAFECINCRKVYRSKASLTRHLKKCDYIGNTDVEIVMSRNNAPRKIKTETDVKDQRIFEKGDIDNFDTDVILESEPLKHCPVKCEV